MTGLQLGLIVAFAVVVGTVATVIVGLLIEWSAARHEREGR
jgi:hypothetical protein